MTQPMKDSAVTVYMGIPIQLWLKQRGGTDLHDYEMIKARGILCGWSGPGLNAYLRAFVRDRAEPLLGNDVHVLSSFGSGVPDIFGSWIVLEGLDTCVTNRATLLREMRNRKRNYILSYMERSGALVVARRIMSDLEERLCWYDTSNFGANDGH